MSHEPDIKYLFEPTSVAVIGASHNPEKIGYKLLSNILRGGYKGNVYPVNPEGGEILGRTVCKRMEEINGDVDVAFIAIPAKFVFDAVKSCAAKRVKFVSIISSGFSEIGNSSEEQKIVAFGKSHSMRIVGPNIFGIYSSLVSLNATFGPSDIKSGNVAIVTQSGALGLAMIGKTAAEGIGLSAIVSVGNRADLDEADILEYLLADSQTHAVIMYVEGVRRGRKLLDMFEKAVGIKPIIVIKAGRSKKGAKAAASHTGSLAGSTVVFDDLVGQYGVLSAENIKEAFNWCKYIVESPCPRGEHTVIITNGGGLGVMTADACEKYGIPLYDDSDELKRIFSPFIPAFGSDKNPVDLTGQATVEQYNSALDAALRSRSIDCVIALYCETAVFSTEDLTRLIQENYHKYKAAGKPMVFSIFGGRGIDECIRSLQDNNIPVLNDTYEAVSVLGALYVTGRCSSQKEKREEKVSIDTASIARIIAPVRDEKRSFLLAHEARNIMRVLAIATPKSYVAHNPHYAQTFANEIGYPVAMKVVSRDILHKSDAGGVVLNVSGDSELHAAYQAILRNCMIIQPKAIIDGIEIAQMVDAGVEIIVGAKRDCIFGPMVMVGLGGVYVEVFKDVAFRAFPTSSDEIVAMIGETKVHALLSGVRGTRTGDTEKLIEVIINLGSLIGACEDMTEIEINPLYVYPKGKGVMAVDIRVILS